MFVTVGQDHFDYRADVDKKRSSARTRQVHAANAGRRTAAARAADSIRLQTWLRPSPLLTLSAIRFNWNTVCGTVCHRTYDKT